MDQGARYADLEGMGEEMESKGYARSSTNPQHDLDMLKK